MPAHLRLLLILTSAALTVFSFPPFNWAQLALIAPIPFLIALADLSPRIALRWGLLHGLLVFAGTLNWLWVLFGPLALLLFLILALFPALFASLYTALPGRQLKLPTHALATAVLWTGTEFFRCEWFHLRFPWITPGTALPPHCLTPWIGVYGSSFLITFTAALIALRWKQRPLAGAATLILITILLQLPAPLPRDPGPTVRIAAIQGESLPFRQYLELSQRIEPPVDAILWPEYALHSDLRESPEQLAAVRSLMAGKKASLFILGTATDHGEASWSNTALLVGREKILGHHDKNRPVHFFNDGKPGTEARSWDTPIGPVAATICFDNDYLFVPRQATLAGAEIFLVPSMDAKSWSARQHLQHAALVPHRAAENGRAFAVASSSGLTQFVDARGRLLDTLPLMEPGVLTGELTLNSSLTFHTRIGWLIGPLCSVATALLGLTMIAITLRRRPDSLSAK